MGEDFISHLNVNSKMRHPTNGSVSRKTVHRKIASKISHKSNASKNIRHRSTSSKSVQGRKESRTTAFRKRRIQRDAQKAKVPSGPACLHKGDFTSFSAAVTSTTIMTCSLPTIPNGIVESDRDPCNPEDSIIIRCNTGYAFPNGQTFSRSQCCDDPLEKGLICGN